MTATSTPTLKVACTRAVSFHGDSSLHKLIFRRVKVYEQSGNNRFEDVLEYE